MKKTKKHTNLPASPDQLQARLGLRSSNAAQPHKNKKAYTRKQKHKAW